MDRLQVLILGQDRNLLSGMRAALQSPGVVGSHFRSDSVHALEALARRHFDGVIIECDDLARAQELVSKIRVGPSNRKCPVLAVLKNMTDQRTIPNSEANFTVCKPAQIKAQLSQALDSMRCEHRRYFRYPADLPLLVGSEQGSFTTARLLNVSEEGMAFWVGRGVTLEGTIRLRFELPSIEPYRIEAKGEVAWRDAEGRTGIKLVYLAGDARRRYMEWLNVLRAQLDFRRLTEERPPTQSISYKPAESTMHHRRAKPAAQRF